MKSHLGRAGTHRRSASRGEPFAAANVRRFLVAAALTAFGQLGAFASSIAEMNAKADLDLVISVKRRSCGCPSPSCSKRSPACSVGA